MKIVFFYFYILLMFDKKLIITELATNAAGKTIPLSLNTKLFEIAEILHN